jgi:CarD family transcriptional regulator
LRFAVGDTVIHPHHGTATVDDLEKRRLDDEDVEYIVLASSFNDLTLKIPVDQVDDIGIRACMSKKRLKQVLDIMAEDASAQKGHWSQRLKRHQARMRSGEPTELATVVRDLTAKQARKGLSPAERRLLRDARRMLHAEMAAVVRGGDNEAERLLVKALADHVEVDEDQD